ncbi:hypothetical protein C0Q70_00626 [Pomacea canaliculata]|uniref:Uncharacterized protein n=1 Tax=Pomacea canaliculata TaxID=400727 RepID=A0A2T7PX61_POMCA|nr:hypothetical protein C0Q70_00626 [Pomacea canaliculata]
MLVTHQLLVARTNECQRGQCINGRCITTYCKELGEKDNRRYRACMCDHDVSRIVFLGQLMQHSFCLLPASAACKRCCLEVFDNNTNGPCFPTTETLRPGQRCYNGDCDKEGKRIFVYLFKAETMKTNLVMTVVFLTALFWIPISCCISCMSVVLHKVIAMENRKLQIEENNLHKQLFHYETLKKSDISLHVRHHRDVDTGHVTARTYVTFFTLGIRRGDTFLHQVGGEDFYPRTGWTTSVDKDGWPILGIQFKMITAHGKYSVQSESSPTTIRVVTFLLTAETGHNWGSPHDPEGECSPSDPQGGRYIMYPIVGPGDQPNNCLQYVFTNFAALFAMQHRLYFPMLRSVSQRCFIESDKEEIPCGNGVVDFLEECDAGPDGLEGKDKCCSSICLLRENANCRQVVISTASVAETAKLLQREPNVNKTPTIRV